MGVYIVTGSASGIGAAISQRLKDDGEHVISVDRNNADINADLSVAEGRLDALNKSKALLSKGLNGLVCCAGIGGSSSEHRLIPEVNVYGSIELVTGLRDELSSAKGSVVLISSNSASHSSDENYVRALIDGDRDRVKDCIEHLDGHRAYSGSKQAIARWVRKHAPDFARSGVRLNAVAPGYTRTAMTEEAEKHPDFTAAIKEFMQSIPIGRAGEAKNIADAIGFLLSREAAFVCGSILYVDGGHDAMFRPDVY